MGSPVPTADDPQTLNAEGVRALDGGDAATAATLFARAAAADPTAPPLWLNLAKAQRLLGDDAGERRSLDRALAIDAVHFMALVRKAELLERLGELPEASKTWGGALAVAPPTEHLPPPLAARLAQAQQFVVAHTAAFGAAIDAGLAEARAGVDPRALRRFNAAVDTAVGRRRVYANDCAGVHFPFLPADEFFEREHFPWMADIEAATPAIRAEIEALLREGAEGFAPYVSMDPGTPENKWTPLDNSMAWSSYYLWKYGEPVAPALARCPATAAALDRLPRADLPGRAPTAFFSVLKPRTRIPPHTGVSNTRTIVHLPLIVPPGCGFRVGGETREWTVGTAFAFDDTIEHEAWNDSDELRAVLIFDVWNPHITEVERDMLRAFFRTADASGFDPNPREAG